MDVGTGHLLSAEEYESQKELLSGLYEPVPDEFADAANLELAGKNEAYIGKHSTGSINTWAEKQRRKKKIMKKARKLGCR